MELKKYSVGQLQEGMIIGRGIYEEDMTVILSEGTVLDRQTILLLENRDIYFVHIRDNIASTPPAYQIDNAKVALTDVATVLDSSRAKAESALLPTLNVMPEVSSPDKDAALAEFMREVADTVAVKSVIRRRAARSVVQTGIAPKKDASLESAYVSQYKDLCLNLSMLYETTRTSGHIDKAAVEILAQQVLPLCSSAKAMTHIYNVRMKGDYSLQHSVRVAILAGLMGQWLKMPQRDRLRLVMAALLLDIGSTRIAPEFLKKVGDYTKEDRVLMQKHTRLGHALVMNSAFASDAQIAGAVLQHHERNDGSGYPDAVKKEQICDFARILAILDSYDAMTSRRSYARRRSPFDVFSALSDEFVANHLDAAYGLPFIRNVYHSLNGNWVRLTNGETGKIVYIDESRLDALPIVQTMDGAFIDLNTLSSIRIESMLTSEEMTH